MLIANEIIFLCYFNIVIEISPFSQCIVCPSSITVF